MTPSENADTVGHVVALLERFPELATIASHPLAGTVVLSFAIDRRLDRAAREELRDSVAEHVRAFLAAVGDEPRSLGIGWDLDEHFTFVRVTRDAQTLCREELSMLTGLFAQRFGGSLLRSESQDDVFEEDQVAQDDAVDCALDALRQGTHRKSLVGIREEKRVSVYFLKARKKAKAAAR